MKILDRVRSIWKSVEGSYRGPAIGYSHWGNPFPIPWGDGFQAGLTFARYGAQEVPIAYACVMATAKAVSSCPPTHKVTDAAGKVTVSTTSPASRVLRRPNAYQTWPQFILNSVAVELFDGEAFVLMRRDNRFAVTDLHLMPHGTCSPYVEPEGGEIFYRIGSNPMLPNGTEMVAPARDVIHLRLHTPRHPLIGESPITAASMALGVNVALAGNQAAFFSNMSRPSGILSVETPENRNLTRDEIRTLRESFDEQSKGGRAGGMPILQKMSFVPMGISSQDAQLIEAQRMSVEDVARCFGVPLPVVGDLSKATLNNVESMINFWLATGLGSLFENLERAFDAAFGLPANEYIEFDERSLLRMDYVKRIEALTKGIQGGVLAPNEARESEGLAPVEGGGTVFLQKQMVPVNLLTAMSVAEIDAKNKPPAAPAAPAADEPAPDEPVKELPDEEEPDDEADPDVSRALVVDLLQRKRKAA